MIQIKGITEKLTKDKKKRGTQKYIIIKIKV